MALFGKRKAKGADPAPAPGGGITDLSDARPPPEESLGSDLGPPAPGSMGPPLQMPPAPPSQFGDEGVPTPPQMSAAMPPQTMGGPMGGPMMGAPQPPLLQSMPMPPAPAFEPSPLGGSADLSMSAAAPVVQAAGGLERLDNVEQRLSDMSRRVDLLDKGSDDIRNDISRIRDSIAQIEGDMRELTSLYDLISTQINPFIDTSTMEEKPAMSVEHGAIPDLDALFEPTPELSGQRVPETAVITETVQAPSEAASAKHEGEVGEAVPSLKVPRLAKIGSDASCHLALMEWIRFLLERVNRVEIPSALSFYQRIGWISGEIKADMLEIIRGIGAVQGEPAPSGGGAPGGGGSSAKDASGDIVIAYGKEGARDLKGPKGQAGGAKAPSKGAEPSTSWRLTPDDHIGSLMYIEWIRSGGDLDRDKLEEIRREVSRLRSGLDGFFSL